MAAIQSDTSEAAPSSSAMPGVDYDQIAHLYDKPSRDHGVDSNLLTFLDERGATGGADVWVIDIGCGAGKQLAADREQWPTARLVTELPTNFKFNELLGHECNE